MSPSHQNFANSNENKSLLLWTTAAFPKQQIKFPKLLIKVSKLPFPLLPYLATKRRKLPDSDLFPACPSPVQSDCPCKGLRLVMPRPHKGPSIRQNDHTEGVTPERESKMGTQEDKGRLISNQGSSLDGVKGD